MEKSEYQRMYTLESGFWWYRVLHELVDATIGKIKKSSPLKMLDAGCGTGKMMEILGKYGEITGIDFSEDAIGFCRKRGLKNLEKGDLNDYVFENDEYDAIVCLDVLYHAAIQDDTAVLEKFFHALKAGGSLVINLAAFEYLKRSHDVVVHTKKRYRKNSFVDDLKKIGFTVQYAGYRMPHLYFIILLAKLFREESKQEESASDLKELSGFMNSLLYNAGRVENWLIKLGFRFPVGSSLFVVAKKQIN
jgi:ubiquinone/menaquinone biosynthesis C-methylase UbiE